MAKKSTSQQADKAVLALLELAAESGWRGISLADVARRSGMSLAELHGEFKSKWGILVRFLDGLDSAQMTGDLPDPEASLRDRLFEVIMRRFEAMRPHRQAIRAILSGTARDPAMWPGGAKRILGSAALMLEAAGVSSSGLRGRIKVKGLAGLYLKVLRVWLDDDGDGMDRTMAALDRALGRVETVAVVLCRGLPCRGTTADAAI
ncbi:MAG TPA: TetR family transcriptional regulator [Rhodospirillaceae bacterium]|nr:TetR family transcriptional regulator [Rhodospirillaceae bacterium]